MKALHSFETSGTYYPVTLRHTLKGSISPVLHHFSTPPLLHLAYLAVVRIHTNLNSVFPPVGCKQNRSQPCSVMKGNPFKTTIFISYYGKPQLKETTLFLH